MYLKRTKFAHYIHKETEIYFGWTGGAKKKKTQQPFKKQTKFTLASDTPELHIPQLNI